MCAAPAARSRRHQAASICRSSQMIPDEVISVITSCGGVGGGHWFLPRSQAAAFTAARFTAAV